MKKILTVLLLTVLMVFCLVSCRQASSVIQNPNQVLAASLTPTYAARFDYFWRALNSHYVFWDVDHTDWDAVYNTYLPKFEDLDKKVNAASEDKKAEVISAAFDTAVQYYKDLTKTLIDHHMAIDIFDPYSATKKRFMPADAEIASRDYYHSEASIGTESGVSVVTWSEATDLVNYFNEGGIGSAADGYKTATNLMSADETAITYYEKYDPATGKGQAATDNIVERFCIAYDLTIDKKNSNGSDLHVVYLGMAKYQMGDWIKAYFGSQTACPTEAEAAFKWKAGKTLITYFSTIKSYYDSGLLGGVLLDNRLNTGGSASDLSLIIGLYTNKPVTVQYTKYKEGFGKTDYSSEVPFTVSANTAIADYYCDLVSADIPYVVLCSLNSVSMGEITTLGISSMSNGYVIGERTWGGTGALLGASEYLPVTYGGTFGDAEKGPVWVYTSTYNPRSYTKDGYKSIEGYGVTPDKEIYYKKTGEDSLIADTQTMLKSQVKEAFSYIDKY